MKTSSKMCVIILLMMAACVAGKTTQKPANRYVETFIDGRKADKLAVIAGLVRAERRAGLTQCDASNGTILFCDSEGRAADLIVLKVNNNATADVIVSATKLSSATATDRRRLRRMLARLKVELEKKSL
jgi:ABC-type proline/glycine betaine transport system ATPase subunit